MENPIKKYIENLRKKAIKDEVDKASMVSLLTSKQKKELSDRISLSFTLEKWMDDNLGGVDLSCQSSFIPSYKQITLFDFLALDIGYKRTVKQAFDDGFLLLKDLLKDIGDDYDRYQKVVSTLNPDIIPLYLFFKDDIEASYSEGHDPHKVIVEQITLLSEKANTGTKVSHAAKFSYPYLKYPKVYKIADKHEDGFIRTGNDRVAFDMHINAAALKVFKFLSLELDGLSILSLIENGKSKSIIKTFNIGEQTYECWELGFRQCLSTQNTETSQRVKQVFFPTGDSYHQLSILFPSGLAFKLKERVDDINVLSMNAYEGKVRRKKSEYYSQTYSTIFDITHQRFGGDHPKNISGLNNKHQNVYLLSSMPPLLQARTVQPPRKNFFVDNLWLKAFADDFQQLHQLLQGDRNNIHIRNKRDWMIRNIVFQVTDRMWLVRQIDAGWSGSDHYQNLSHAQKVWLDQQYDEQRDENLEWLESIKLDMTRWFINAYRKIIGDQALDLGDEQMPHIKSVIADCEEALR